MTERRRLIRLVWINTGIVLAVTVLVIAATWYFTQKRIQILGAELATVKETEKAMNSKKAELPTIAANLPRLLDESRVVALIFPNNPAQKELVDFLQQNVDKAGADVTKVSMDSPTELPVYSKAVSTQTDEEKALDKTAVEKTMLIKSTMTVRGGFENILAFMENMKRSNRFFRIMKIKAGPETNKSGDRADIKLGSSLIFELDGELYYTTEKLDIADKFAKLRDALKEIMAYQEPPAVEKPSNGLIEVKDGGTNAAKTNKEEQPAK
jgi:hypothetical protein